CEVTFARFFPAASPYSANPPADSAPPQVSLFRAIHSCGLLGEDRVDALGVVLRLIRVLLRSHRYETAYHFAQLGLHPRGRARGCGPLGLPVEQGGAMLVYALVHGSLEAAVLVRMAAGPLFGLSHAKQTPRLHQFVQLPQHFDVRVHSSAPSPSRSRRAATTKSQS